MVRIQSDTNSIENPSSRVTVCAIPGKLGIWASALLGEGLFVSQKSLYQLLSNNLLKYYVKKSPYMYSMWKYWKIKKAHPR